MSDRDATKHAKYRVTSTACTQLNNLAGILKESARIYRLSLLGRLSVQDATRYHFMLGNMRQTLEAMAKYPELAPPPQQIDGSAISIISVPSNHFLSADDVAKIRAQEQFVAHGGNGIDDNATKQ